MNSGNCLRSTGAYHRVNEVRNFRSQSEELALPSATPLQTRSDMGSSPDFSLTSCTFGSRITYIRAAFDQIEEVVVGLFNSFK